MNNPKLSSLLFCIVCALSIAPLQAEGLMIYSSRNASYLTPLLNDYSAETGIGISYLIDSPDALIRRLETESEGTPADLFLTTGVQNLVLASQKGVLAPITSKRIMKVVPVHLRSRENEWFTIAKRAEAIAYNPDKVLSNELSTYSALAEAKWKNRLCMRSTRTEYTQSLLAALTHTLGKTSMLSTLKGWKSNLAKPTMADDLEILQAIDRGECDVAIIYSYYLPRHQQTNSESKVKIFWPNQDEQGVVIDITAAGVVADSNDKELATHLLEWLLTKKTQARYARLSMEYPVHESVYPDRKVAKHGKFKENKSPVEELASYQSTANSLARKAKLR